MFNLDFSLNYVVNYETACVSNLSQALVRKQAYLIKVLFNRLYKFKKASEKVFAFTGLE